MNKYKTFEELKEELGDKFEDYMYKANIELLNKLDKIKENTKRTIEIIKQQPTEDDTWILERLNSNLKILEEIE